MFEDLVGHLRRRLDLREPQRLVVRLVLQSLEIDLELGPAVGRRRIEQVGGQHIEGIGEVADEPDLRLDLAVLEQREIRRRAGRPSRPARPG